MKGTVGKRVWRLSRNQELKVDYRLLRFLFHVRDLEALSMEVIEMFLNKEI